MSEVPLYMYLKEVLVGLALVIHLCPGRALSATEAHSSLAYRKCLGDNRNWSHWQKRTWQLLPG